MNFDMNRYHGKQVFILPGGTENFEVIIYFFQKIIFVRLQYEGGKLKSAEKMN